MRYQKAHSPRRDRRTRCAPTSHRTGPFPDYELSDHAETRRRLSELQRNDPMILVLSRGHYCPKDHQQHLQLAAFQSQITVACTQIVTISTDSILETREFRDAVGARWTFLSDAGRVVQKDLDIQEYTDPYHDPMIPHTLVLKPRVVTSTTSTTATGSGAGRRSRTSGATFARSRARSGRTGISPRPACARPGRRASARSSIPTRTPAADRPGCPGASRARPVRARARGATVAPWTGTQPSGTSRACGSRSAWVRGRPRGSPARLFGLDAAANPQSPYLARLFGVRDVALAWGALSSEGDTQRQWLLAGLACDVADALAGVAGGRGGYLPKRHERARDRHGGVGGAARRIRAARELAPPAALPRALRGRAPGGS